MRRLDVVGGSALMVIATVLAEVPVHAQSGTAGSSGTGQQEPVAAPREDDRDPLATENAQADVSDDNRIGEIIVTATRRAQPLQRIPVAASVIGGENWERTSNFSLENVAQSVPSVTFESTTSARNNTVRIRGVGSSTSSSGVEPSTSTVLDGVVLIRSGQAAAANLIDISRIEVLRGPQGTLFGKNASVGVVNIVTMDPTRDFSGRVDGLLTEDGERQIRGSVSAPISDTLSARLSAFYRKYDGNVRNVFDGDKQNAAENFGVRGKLLWRPTEDLSIRLSADYGQNDSNCCARPLRNLNLTNPRAVVEGRFLLPVVAGPRNRLVNTDVEPNDSYKSDTFAAEVNYELGGYTLTSITAHQDFKINQQIDDDLTSIGPVAGGQTFKQRITSVEDVNGDTQEFRLTSPTGGPFDFVAGLYFLDAKIRQVSSNFRRRLAVPNNQVSTYDTTTNFRNYAAFGQLNYHLTEELTVLLGGRYTIDRVRNRYVRIDDPVAPFRSGSTSYDLTSKEKDFSVKTGIQYQVTPRVFTYATFAEGYKGPGFNVASNGLAPNARLKPETSKNYELGAKTRLLDNRLAFNIALFQSNFEDFVVNAIDPATNSVQLVNAASLRTRGAEIDFDLRVGRNLSVYGGVAYVKATVDIENTPCYDFQTLDQGCFNLTPTTRVQNIEDGDLPLSPDWKFNVGANYAIPLPDMPFDINLRGNVVYTGRQQFSLNQDPTRIFGAYALVDAAVAFTSKDDRFTFEVFGRNLTDKFYVTGIATVTELTGASLQFIPRDSSRYFGARLSATF